MNKRNSLPKTVLLTLEKSVDGYIRMEDFLNNPGFYAYEGGWQYPLKKDILSQTLKRLREKGLIDFKNDKNIFVKLTDLEEIKLCGLKWRLKD